MYIKLETADGSEACYVWCERESTMADVIRVAVEGMKTALPKRQRLINALQSSYFEDNVGWALDTYKLDSRPFNWDNDESIQWHIREVV